MPRIRVSISYLSESEQKTSTESRQKLTNVYTSQRALIGRKVLCRRREGDLIIITKDVASLDWRW